MTVTQNVTGEYNLDTYLYFNKKDFRRLFPAFAEEELTEIDELCKTLPWY
ncbi:hypothetical protein KHA80_00400 [Anaerobacillus sp. HL2]|nr:hypothetical protein KHA80_00400 [Anaerobacillus sp. HL2]